MATAGTSGGEIALRIVLALAILALIVVLFYVTVVPAQRVAAAQRAQDLTRERMSDTRTALIAYRDSLGHYPATLDSLGIFLRGNPAVVEKANAMEGRHKPYNVDSLAYSPRTGNRFLYEVISDSSGVEVYWLDNPDVPGDSIGARDPNPALRNTASWE